MTLLPLSLHHPPFYFFPQKPFILLLPSFIVIFSPRPIISLSIRIYTYTYLYICWLITVRLKFNQKQSFEL
ncbi:hypothetical protein L1987_86765 [Smallanthus sonchifolius]|uniref:Uncharacterized protein n=1 Tax=Smallanthus sonchifolius TaxID=185202 RepID=A0ACB8Y0R7_9ASTR|nr:hypothetical protein L1987_86765 [Smallanthus sonchifolius]